MHITWLCIISSTVLYTSKHRQFRTACNNKRSLSWHSNRLSHVVPAQLVCTRALSVTCTCMFSYISCYATVLVCTLSHKQFPCCTVAQLLLLLACSCKLTLFVQRPTNIYIHMLPSPPRHQHFSILVIQQYLIPQCQSSKLTIDTTCKTSFLSNIFIHVQVRKNERKVET